MARSNGLMSLLGGAPRGAARIPGGETGDAKHGKTFARYDGSDAPATEYFSRGGSAGHSAVGAQRRGYFAKGGMADPLECEPEVSPELKLAAYELLEAFGSSSFGDNKAGRAEAFAKALLTFVRLADAEPHEEGEHEGAEPDEGAEVDDGEE